MWIGNRLFFKSEWNMFDVDGYSVPFELEQAGPQEEILREDGHGERGIVITSAAGMLKIENLFFLGAYCNFTFIREPDSENIDVYLSRDGGDFDLREMNELEKTFDQVVASSGTVDDDFEIDLNIFLS